MPTRWKLFLLLLLLAPAACRPAGNGGASEEPYGSLGKARVVDGDTLLLTGERHRLFGIDAPELDQHCLRQDGDAWPCGKAAAEALAARIAGQAVLCRWSARDRYGRPLSRCRLAEEELELNAWMVAEGWALAFRRYSELYLAEEARAAAGRRGLWSGSFTPPWDWRRGRRRPPSVPGPYSRPPRAFTSPRSLAAWSSRRRAAARKASRTAT